MNKEIWKDIKGYEGIYRISNLGRVKSLERQILYKDGRKYTYKEKLIGIRNGKNGYKVTDLSKNGITKTYYIHRLLAKHFISNPDNFECINHIDGNKQNNDITNLEWINYSGNLQHAYDTGLRNNNKRIIQYDLDGNFVKKWSSIQKAQKELNLYHIWDVCIGKRKTCGHFIWKYE